jgi:hypothetical protein
MSPKAAEARVVHHVLLVRTDKALFAWAVRCVSVSDKRLSPASAMKVRISAAYVKVPAR